VEEPIRGGLRQAVERALVVAEPASELGLELARGEKQAHAGELHPQNRGELLEHLARLGTTEGDVEDGPDEVRDERIEHALLGTKPRVELLQPRWIALPHRVAGTEDERAFTPVRSGRDELRYAIPLLFEGRDADALPRRVDEIGIEAERDVEAAQAVGHSTRF